MLDWSLRTARELTDGVVVVVPADMANEREPLADMVVVGGASRSQSVSNGLAAVPDDIEHVLVHDAARPVPVLGVWNRVIAALRSGADAVIPVVPVTDTLRELGGTTVDRDRFRAVQTPQGFTTAVLRAAHAGAADATDDASLVEALGVEVQLVDGDSTNIKITDPWHLAIADILTR